MSTQDIFRRLSEALQAAAIPYMLTGSFASSYYGAPRASQDIDIVIAPTEDQLRKLGQFLGNDYFFDLEDALDARKRTQQFNVIDMNTGWKVDFIIRKSRPFSQMEFDRRVRAEVDGVTLFITSAEDIVLAKLEWAKRGASERQIEDAAGILRVRWNDLDHNYLGRWIDALDLRKEWDRAITELQGT